MRDMPLAAKLGFILLCGGILGGALCERSYGFAFVSLLLGVLASWAVIRKA